jgi:hypothetical protein
MKRKHCSVPAHRRTLLPVICLFFFTMSTEGDHKFKDPVLRAEFDILPPAEGSGRKIDIVHCRNCGWHHALHAPRMKKHLENCESYKRRHICFPDD